MPPLRARTLAAALLLSAAAHSQKPQTPPPVTAPQLSPKAAYDDAMHPLEATRHSIANWSDIEVGALYVAIDHAKTECAARDPKTFSGDTLIDLARLCALGQAWPAVVQASTLYIAADTPTKPQLNQAYAAKIDAELHLKDEPSALADAQTMLRLVPYDALSAEIVDETIEYMQFTHTADAITLDVIREPLLLAQISAKPAAAGPAKPATPAATSAYPAQSIHDFYAAGLGYAALQQLAGQPEAAQATVAALDAALPANLTPDDALPIATARKRYAFLGQPLPAIAMLASLSMPNRLPELPAPHAITALLLFPDWCAYCVRMGNQFPQSVFLVERHEAYFYGLLAETQPPVKSAPPAAGAEPKPAAREVLAETPTVVVPPSVLDQFVAADFPFLIIADSHGIVRVLQPVDQEAIQSGGTLDSAVAHIGSQWPTTPPKAPIEPATGGLKAASAPQP